MHLVERKMYEFEHLNQLLQKEIKCRQILESKLRSLEAQMQGVLEAITDIVLVVSTCRDKIESIEFLPTRQQDLDSNSFDIVSQTVDLFSREDTSEIWRKQVLRALKTRLTHSFNYSLSCNGGIKQYCATITPISDHSVMWVARDSCKYVAVKEVEKREEKFQVLVNSAPVGIFETDVNGDCTYVNRRWSEIAGMSEAKALGKGWVNALYPEDREKVVKQWYSSIALGCEFTMEFRFITPQGKVTWLKGSAVAIRDVDNNITGYLGTITDIDARKLVEKSLKISEAQEKQKVQELELVLKKLRELVNKDGLTQVANRYCFDNYLRKQWYTKNPKNPIALILLDIDYFKLYNDTYGHPAGDACLVQVANALLGAIKHDNALVARYGGEEFAIILPNTTSVQAQQVAQDIRKYIQQLSIPHKKSSVSANVTVSMGIAQALPYLNMVPKELLDKADEALYEAKRAGRDCYCTVFN